MKTAARLTCLCCLLHQQLCKFTQIYVVLMITSRHGFPRHYRLCQLMERSPGCHRCTADASNSPAFTGNLSSLRNDAGFLLSNESTVGNVFTGAGQNVSFGNIAAMRGNVVTLTTSKIQLPNAPAFNGNLSTLLKEGHPYLCSKGHDLQ